jgi:hypothetical protein
VPLYPQNSMLIIAAVLLLSDRSKVPAAYVGYRSLFPLSSSFTEKEEDSAEGMRRFKKSRTRARKAQAMVRGSPGDLHSAVASFTNSLDLRVTSMK